ncbi:SWIM zinc finger domain-containing protein [Cesiribacter sp. SM1]|uniref:SWIM zinc finger family protein n=1 Tax=Cesiribacter sp. SM1 TaxID=2861196 RepID=UPI001CD4BA00|nr:SWIM zinc finger family protein [Cesiribacter sp. SM1]
MQFTEDQIIQLSPDAASTKAGQQLATTAKWVARHAHERALWGDCQGSGKNPYRTVIDLSNIAFKCSCPSRKFPCKHGLGLFLLYAKNKEAFTREENLSADVEEWLGKRESRAVAKEVKEGTTPDSKAKEKRAEEREKKVSAGLEELRMWLKDLVRGGIMHIPGDAYKFNQAITARMVDAQAGGVAGMLRRLSNINYYQDGWQQPFLKKIASLYLLTEAYKQLESCSDLPAEDIRSLIGWSTPKEQVLQQDGVKDQWLVLAKSSEVDDRLTIERTWLWGCKTEKFALLLNFYAPGQLPGASSVEGSMLEAELAFYPSALPLRALIKEQHATKPIPEPLLSRSFSDLEQEQAVSLSVLPFIDQLPKWLSPARIFMQKGSWFLADSNNKTARLLNAEDDCWKTLSISGGEDFTAFILYEPEGIWLMALWFNHTYHTLS